MGREVFTRSLYTAAKSTASVSSTHVTKRAEQKAIETGKLEPLVDPAGFGTTRLSLPRVEKKEDDTWEMLVGTPMPIETRVDTTGSMGNNVDVAMDVLPDAFESWSKVLDGYDIQVATGIFGDVKDNFVLCRPQFEMDALKIVKQLTLMVPEHGGGDNPEDPDLGIFGGAYLCRHYINRIGLKGYDFTVTDAPGRGIIDPEVVKRVFGDKAFDKASENGHQISQRGPIQLKDVWSALLDRAHAFVLLVGHSRDTKHFWSEHVGSERVISLPNTKHLPCVQAAIIGLTEGTLTLNDTVEFLQQLNMKKKDAETVSESLANIPIGAQMQLPNFSKIPKKGDVFEGKPDVWEDKYLWPVSNAMETADNEQAPEETDDWL